MSNLTLANQALSFQHPQLVRRLSNKLGLSLQEADNLFLETKKFLYLCIKHREEDLRPSEMVDECWHLFILFTKDYFTFCKNYLGSYIHHKPNEEDITDAKITREYSLTLELYEKEFGKPSEFWFSAGDCSGSTNCQGSADCSTADKRTHLEYDLV